MEVVAIASSVCSLCQSILTWIDDLAEKQSLIQQIASTIQQIHDILSPFSFNKSEGIGEIQLSQCIRSVGDVLERARDHLIVWKSRRTQKILAFLNPRSAIDSLKEDQRKINHQLVILLTAIATVGYFRDRETNVSATPLIIQTPEKTQERESLSTLSSTEDEPFDPLEGLDDKEAREFWCQFIGSKIEFVDNSLFSYRLAMWYRVNVNQKAFSKIMMCLDEYNSGVVTPYNLSRALEKRSLREFMDMYLKDEPQFSSIDCSSILSTDLKPPLLVWIDDSPGGLEYEISLAQKLGIHVVQILSTAIAKTWVEANIALLRKIDNASDLRFISDNVRLESGVDTGPYLNPTAGQAILRFLRGRLIKAPVLIYAGQSIRSTGYVNEYDSAGSTNSTAVTVQYIANLGARVADDRDWKGFMCQRSNADANSLG